MLQQRVYSSVVLVCTLARRSRKDGPYSVDSNPSERLPGSAVNGLGGLDARSLGARQHAEHRLHRRPVRHARNIGVRRAVAFRLGPWVVEMPVEQKHLHARLGAVQRVAGVVVNEHLRADGGADLALLARLALQCVVVTKVHLRRGWFGHASWPHGQLRDAKGGERLPHAGVKSAEQSWHRQLTSPNTSGKLSSSQSSVGCWITCCLDVTTIRSQKSPMRCSELSAPGMTGTPSWKCVDSKKACTSSLDSSCEHSQMVLKSYTL